MTHYEEKLQTIQDEISQGAYEQARQDMDALKAEGAVYDDVAAILDASIYEALGDRDNTFAAIRDGLAYSHRSFELYYMLGHYYLPQNADQAYLCFQNALLYCDNTQDASIINADMETLAASGQITVKGTAIIIVSYNACYMMQQNIAQIRSTLLPESYRIIVVDNASDDGIAEWLAAQDDVMLLTNTENKGFSPACNQAVSFLRKTAYADYDIFLLNNDTRLAPNTLFWLKMGLYENAQVGACGSISNYAGNNQQVDVTFSLPSEYLEYGAANNISCVSPYEERVRLSGFAMLIRGRVWDLAGGMDEAFAPGYFEDDDLSMKILQSGHRLIVCKNSFLYHAGSQSFIKRPDVEDLLMAHYRLFIEKYGFPILEYADADIRTLSMIPYPKQTACNILQIGSGLGADLKYLRSSFPNANVVGIESRESLRRLSCKTELVLPNLKAAADMFQHPVFHIVLMCESVRSQLQQEDLLLLRSLCRPDCIILPPPAQNRSYLDKLKLVIWDLDQTFWSGTLSEGGISPIDSHAALLKALTECGIVNSVSSKNDAEAAEEVLHKLGVSDYFVFNNINWQSKGEQIRKKLEDMHLRSENVLFIDDDRRNLEEALYYNPGLHVETPDFIPALQRYISAKTPTDLSHGRLAHYKLLEEKREAQNRFSSKEDFLFHSEICLTLHTDCRRETQRIAELVARTNQLNYTKKRDSQEDLLALLTDDSIPKGYIRVKDRFGDYGIVGFYCYERDGSSLRHFLFSCRTMGMGIAQCVYKLLGCPQMEVVPPVSADLDKDAETPWIRIVRASDDDARPAQSEKQTGSKIKVLLKGPCDMSSIETYLSGGDLTCEFNFVNDRGFITAGQNHSMHIYENAVYNRQQRAEILADVPFITQEDFETTIFDRAYDVICYSLLPDCHAGLYRHKESGFSISFGSKNFDLTDPANWQGYIDGSIVNHAFPFTREILQNFAKNWEFLQVTTPEDLIRNLEYIYTHAPGNPMFVLLLGSEIEYEGRNDEFADHATWHKRINACVKEYAESKERIRIIEMTDYIHSQEDYADCINHFSRDVYYRLAGTVCSCINDKVEMLLADKH